MFLLRFHTSSPKSLGQSPLRKLPYFLAVNQRKSHTVSEIQNIGPEGRGSENLYLFVCLWPQSHRSGDYQWTGTLEHIQWQCGMLCNMSFRNISTRRKSSPLKRKRSFLLRCLGKHQAPEIHYEIAELDDFCFTRLRVEWRDDNVCPFCAFPAVRTP